MDCVASLGLRALGWATAMAVDAMIDMVGAGVDDRMGKWAHDLRKWTKSSSELEATAEVRRDLHMGWNALSASMSAIAASHQESSRAILAQMAQLMEEISIRDFNAQHESLKRATDAINDICGRRFPKGDRRNVRLLERARDNAEEAARALHCTVTRKLRAYRLWIIADYVYEVTSGHSCRGAKESALFILGRVILNDSLLLQICQQYSSPQAPQTPRDLHTGDSSVPPEITFATPARGRASMNVASSGRSRESVAREGSTASGYLTPASGYLTPAFRRSSSRDEVQLGRSGVLDDDPSASSGVDGNKDGWGADDNADTLQVLDFLLEIMSSVMMLPPLDQDVAYPDVVSVIGAGVKEGDDEGHVQLMGGELCLGPRAPQEIIFAMGRYCALNPDKAKLYPSVSAVALNAWEKGKERRAMDNFFVKTGGEHWHQNRGWTDPKADLGDRFGVAMENGHVVKINLAANNLNGSLDEDLADCEHLRELVLHENYIHGDVPGRMKELITRTNMTVTGIPCLSGEMTPAPPLGEAKSLSQLGSSSSSVVSTASSAPKKKKGRSSWGKSWREYLGSDMSLGFTGNCRACGATMETVKCGKGHRNVCPTPDCPAAPMA